MSERALPGVRLAESLGSGCAREQGEDPARATAPTIAPAATAAAPPYVDGGHCAFSHLWNRILV